MWLAGSFVVLWLLGVIEPSSPSFAVFQHSRVAASQGGLGAGRDISGNQIYQDLRRYDPELLKQTVKICLEKVEASRDERATALHRADDIARDLGVTQDAVLAFFRVLNQEEEVDTSRLLGKLVEVAVQFKTLQRHISDVEVVSPEAEQLLQSARADIDRGRLLDADYKLAHAAEAETKLARSVSATTEQGRLRVRQYVLSAVAIDASRGFLLLTRLRYEDAATRFETARDRLRPLDSGEDTSHDADVAYWRQNTILAEANAWYFSGLNNNRSAHYASAANLFRAVFEADIYVPLENYAESVMRFGHTLVALSDHDLTPKRLEAAIQAYHTAVAERAMPLNFFQSIECQIALGKALIKLGRLQEAVAVFRQAVKGCETCIRRRPEEWAMAKANLGTALAMLAEQENDTERGDEALATVRDALTAFTSSRDSIIWAKLQMSLGYALTWPSEKALRPQALTAAIQALRSGLNVFVPERNLSEWTMAQLYLGRALEAQGRLDTRRQALEEAMQAYSAVIAKAGAAYPQLAEKARDGRVRIQLALDRADTIKR